MIIYTLTKTRHSKDIEKHLNNLGVRNLYKKNKKSVLEYGELTKDEKDKIVVISPGLFEWKFSNKTIDAIPNLKAIVTRSSWGNYIDVGYANKKGIIIVNSPGVNAQSVAEYALFQMFALARNFPQQIRDSYRVCKDEDHLGIEIKDKTVGILGLGRIGSRIAKMCDGMGANIVYWNRSPKNNSYSSLTIAEVLKKSDVIFKTWETIPATNKLLHKDNLNLLKKTALFISVFGGIGWSDDSQILLEMAEKGRIGGFSVENGHHEDAKVKDEYKGNIFIPGAYAWLTKETQNNYGQLVANNIHSIIKGSPINIVK